MYFILYLISQATSGMDRWGTGEFGFQTRVGTGEVFGDLWMMSFVAEKFLQLLNGI